MKKHHDVWDRDVEQILISEKELDEIVTRMAAQIDADYRDKNLLLLCILKGSLVFMGDLMKKLSIPCEIDCMKVSSYGNGSVSSGRINILLDLHRHDLSEKDIDVYKRQPLHKGAFYLSPPLERGGGSP